MIRSIPFRRLSMTAAFVAVLGAIVSCSPQPTDPAIAKSAFDAGPALSQAQIGECMKYVRLANQVDAVISAKFSPGLTLKFAKRFSVAQDEMKPYATRIRAYDIEYEIQGIFGRGTPNVACYFENTQPLRFLTAIKPNAEGKVHNITLNDAILVAYAKMAGKDITKVRLFGVYAD